MRNADLTPDQQAELEVLAAMSDADIDTSDIPEIIEFSNPRRGVFSASPNVKLDPEPVGIPNGIPATTDAPPIPPSAAWKIASSVCSPMAAATLRTPGRSASGRPRIPPAGWPATLPTTTAATVWT